VPEQLRGRLGLAVGLKTYQAYRRLMDSDRWQRLANAGARVQRLLWASTSTKDPNSPDTMYIDGLRAPHTINTMPESTLRAFADHGQVGEPIAVDGGDAEAALAQFESAGVDVDALAATLQSEGARNFVKSWDDLLTRIDNQLAVVA
jgi:transaldolase